MLGHSPGPLAPQPSPLRYGGGGAEGPSSTRRALWGTSGFPGGNGRFVATPALSLVEQTLRAHQGPKRLSQAPGPAEGAGTGVLSNTCAGGPRWGRLTGDMWAGVTCPLEKPLATVSFLGPPGCSAPPGSRHGMSLAVGHPGAAGGLQEVACGTGQELEESLSALVDPEPRHPAGGSWCPEGCPPQRSLPTRPPAPHGRVFEPGAGSGADSAAFSPTPPPTPSPDPSCLWSSDPLSRASQQPRVHWPRARIHGSWVPGHPSFFRGQLAPMGSGSGDAMLS